MRLNLRPFLVLSLLFAGSQSSLAENAPYAPEAQRYQELVQFLHFVDQNELARPYAQRLFSEKNYWQSRELIELLPSDDHYLSLWQAALAAEDWSVYQDFIDYNPNGALTPFAIHQHYQLANAENTLESYQNFLNQHPNAPESVLALEQAIIISFQRAVASEKIENLELFAAAFAISPLAAEALHLAESRYQQEIEGEIAKIAARQERFSDRLARLEQLARKIYNEARRLEKNAGNQAPVGDAAKIHWQAQRYQAERRYRVIEQLFSDSKVASEMLDLEELRAFRNEMKQEFSRLRQEQAQQFTNMSEELNRMTALLSQTIVQEAEKTRAVVREEGDKTRVVVREEADKTRVVVREESNTIQGAIARENARIAAQFSTYEQQMQTLIAEQRNANVINGFSTGARLVQAGASLVGLAASFSNPISAVVSVGLAGLNAIASFF